MSPKAGYDPADVDDARAQAPWYRTKAQPSVADMLTKLRRVIIANQFRHTDPQPATPAEINILRLAWTDTSRINAKVERDPLYQKSSRVSMSPSGI